MESLVARNGEVRIRYLAAGSGPPLVFLHGFPDHSLGWRRQIERFAPTRRVIAPDLRGFGASDAPSAVSAYALPHLVDDVRAVLQAEGVTRADIVGHDWGGFVAWWLAIRFPAAVRRLVALSAPHPRRYLQVFADPANQNAVAYVRSLQAPGAERSLDPEELSAWVQDPGDREALAAVLRRSRLDAMLNLYRANVPRGPAPDLAMPLLRVPAMVIYGVQDPYVPAEAFERTQAEAASALAVLALPHCGHFIHHEAADFINDSIADWIGRADDSFRPSFRTNFRTG